jgi:hypothetical protein
MWKLLQRICLCGPLAIVLLAGFLSVWRPAAKGSGINKANFDLIEEGMTQKEVEHIFGCPPGDYTNGEALCFRPLFSSDAIREEIWTGYDGDIDVEFSMKDGKVINKHYGETSIYRSTWLDRIKRFCLDAFSVDAALIRTLDQTIKKSKHPRGTTHQA